MKLWAWLWAARPGIVAAQHDDVAEVRRIGVDAATELCARQLDAGAPGLHFYTLNQAGLTTEIVRRLNLAG